MRDTGPVSERREDPPRRFRRLGEGQLVALALLALLVFLVVRTHALRIEARRAAFDEQRLRLAAAVQLTHARWMVGSERAAGPLELEERRTVFVNGAGWPTLDPRHPEQDRADELWRTLLDRPLGEGWWSAEVPAREAGLATFHLRGAGGGSFAYDARDGSVRTRH